MGTNETSIASDTYANMILLGSLTFAFCWETSHLLKLISEGQMYTQNG